MSSIDHDSSSAASRGTDTGTGANADTNKTGATSSTTSASAASPTSTVLNSDDAFVFFWETVSVFSQWHKSRFTVDGVEYDTAEKFMMAGKARLFGDSVALGKILASSSAREIKAYGRGVVGFDEQLWQERREDIIYRGNRAKFEQNPEMLQKLRATGTRQLVEAAPNDRVWGIGLTADEARVTPVADWPGLNLLGKALMRVRDELCQQ